MNEDLRLLVCSALGLDSNSYTMDENTKLLGSVPELDSMAVVSILTAIEENFDIIINDDEVTADVFNTFGDLYQFVDSKINEK